MGGRAFGPLDVGLGELVAAQRPEAERDEGHRGDDRERAGGDRRAERRTDEDRHGMDERGRDGDADEHRDPRIAGCERQRHELGLVAQLGHEDDGNTEEERAHAGRSLADPRRNRCRVRVLRV